MRGLQDLYQLAVDGGYRKSQLPAMAHLTSPQFWQHHQRLPLKIQNLADKNYDLLKANPLHPSLHFKKVDSARRRWSVRVGENYRALGMEVPEGFLWVWIGPHAEYDRMLK